MVDSAKALALLQQIESSPARPMLPLVVAPSLEGIQVVADPPNEVNEDDIANQLGQWMYAKCERRRRSAGEKVAEGDLVDVDVIAYRDGKLVPRLCGQHLDVPLHSGVLADGFFEHVVEQEVGSSSAANVQVAVDSQTEPMDCVWAIKLRRASEVTLLDAEDPKFLELAGAETVNALMENVLDEVAQLRATDSWLAAVRQVFVELKNRAGLVVPTELVDFQCALGWQKQQGELLSRAGISLDERACCLAETLSNAQMRADVEHQLAVMTLLDAICRRDQIQLTVDEAIEELDELGEALQVDPKDWAKVFTQDEAALCTFANNLAFQRAISHVLSHVDVVLESGPK
jgi:FKBP-type peptidyl-prolyl cis-trans isomerase (trigger factor)